MQRKRLRRLREFRHEIHLRPFPRLDSFPIHGLCASSARAALRAHSERNRTAHLPKCLPRLRNIGATERLSQSPCRFTALRFRAKLRESASRHESHRNHSSVLEFSFPPAMNRAPRRCRLRQMLSVRLHLPGIHGPGRALWKLRPQLLVRGHGEAPGSSRSVIASGGRQPASPADAVAAVEAVAVDRLRT